ncbi:MAG: glycosyltransferase family 4 protein, partial [Desulfobacterales bacterium]|nr:glycosyltransferase family 4 protein [Desulfobacterales bacterium]
RRTLSILTRNNLRYDRGEDLAFNRIHERLHPDLVWLETPYLLRYALGWKNEVPVIVDYWGTSEGARRLFDHSWGIDRAKAWLRWWVGSGCERRYAKRLQDLVCVSQVDTQYFRSIAPQCRVWSVPNGIQEEPFSSADKAVEEDPWTMLLTGDLSYPPNVDAALFFAEHIFPKIRQALPEAVFRLVGRDPSPSLRWLHGQPGITLVGFVPDLAQEIRRCTIYVLPMRLGSGIRSKLFDVFPLAKAIVTTSVGAEGLELAHGKNCLIADGEADFARFCVQLLTDEVQRKRLGAAVKKLATEVYSQGKIDAAVRKIVTTIAGR